MIAKGQPLSLGSTEFRLLHFLVTHTDRVYSRSQLLDHVWGPEFVGDDRTVDVHISRLRNALLPSGLDHVIRTVRGSGYSLSGT
ncbi:Phosphate regulon transcriptional regulatory protein PhoB [compost metagenome]